MQLEDFAAKTDGGGLVGGEEGVVGFFVEEVALQEDEVGGEKDVGAELIEEGVEGGRGGGVEGGEGTCGRRVVSGCLGGIGGGLGVGTVFSACWGGGEGAGLLETEASETGAAVVG